MNNNGSDPMRYSQWNEEIDNERALKTCGGVRMGLPRKSRVKSLRISDVAREVAEEMARDAAKRMAASSSRSDAPKLSVDQIVRLNSNNQVQVYTANMWNERAKNKPVQEDLYMGIWHSNEVGCLFSDSNTGKSVLAVQIAEHLARQGRVVAYYDAEMGEEQFLSRYRDDATGEVYKFAQSLYILRPSPDDVSAPQEGEDAATMVLNHIRKIMTATQATDLVLDNLTALCDASYKSEEAAKLMRNLRKIKDQCKWNVLVVAHTPKRDMSQVITQNDLGGSKLLFNLFDSVFALGMSRLEPGVRYLKQLKSRIGKIKYDEDHVLTAVIEKRDGFLQLVWDKEVRERQHLMEPLVLDEEVQSMAVEMFQQQATIMKVAEATGLSKSAVGRLRVKLKNRGLI